MLDYDYLIIGGGIAGTTCAEVLRSKDSYAKIAILDGESTPLYSKVLIPSYLKGRIAREKVILRKISHYQSESLDLFSNTRVGAVDALKHEVLTESNQIFSYKKLLISSGGIPKKLTEMFSSTTPIEPLRLHTLKDADKIDEIIKSSVDKKILVVGESFIALEFLEIFKIAGFEVHAAVRGQLWGEERIGKEGSRIMEENFIKNKIIIHRNAELTFIRNDEFYLKSGDHLKAPFWALGIGIARNLSFAGDIEKKDGIITDEYLRTSNPDIYAAGDIAEFYDVVAGHRRLIGNWTNSFLQGRAAALNMLASLETSRSGLGDTQAFKAVPAYNIVNMGINLTYVGDTAPAGAGAEVAEIFERADEKRLLRVLIKGGKVSGGVLINRFSDKLALTRLIEQGAAKDELEKTFN